MPKTSIALVMTYKPRSGRYLIEDTEGWLFQPPTEERICELWQETVPGVEFYVGNVISGSVNCLYVQIGSGTKPKQRADFCAKLAAECRRAT